MTVENGPAKTTAPFPADLPPVAGADITTAVTPAAAEVRFTKAEARTAWTAVAVLLSLYALAMLDRQIIALLVKPIRADLGISDFEISLLQGFAFSVLFCILGLPLGYAVDKISRRLVIVVGVLIWAAAATASGLASNFTELFLARLFVGVGEAALAPAAFSILSGLFPRQRLTFALSVYSIGALIGSSIAYGVGATVIEFAQYPWVKSIFGSLQPWQIAFIVTGLPGFVFAFMIYLIPEPPRGSGRGAAAAGQLMAFIKSRWTFLLPHFIGYSCMGILAYANMAWMPTFLARTYHMPITSIGLVMVGYTLIAGSAAMLTSGRVVDWMTRRGYTDAHFRFYIFASMLVTCTGSLSFWAPNPYVFYAIFSWGAVATAMGAVAASAMQIVTPPELRGRMSAIYLLVTGLIGMISGPALVAALTDFVFQDDAKLYAALSTVHLVTAPIGCLAFVIGLKPMRRAVAMARAHDAAMNS